MVRKMDCDQTRQLLIIVRGAGVAMVVSACFFSSMPLCFRHGSGIASAISASGLARRVSSRPK